MLAGLAGLGQARSAAVEAAITLSMGELDTSASVAHLAGEGGEYALGRVLLEGSLAVASARLWKAAEGSDRVHLRRFKGPSREKTMVVRRRDC